MADRRALEALALRAGEVAVLLREIGSRPRLLVRSRLAGDGEAAAGALAEGTGLSQRAVSQHLARLRRDGVVAQRRRGRRSSTGSRIPGRRPWWRCCGISGATTASSAGDVP